MSSWFGVWRDCHRLEKEEKLVHDGLLTWTTVNGQLT
jgi:hypothetical protein